MAPILDMYCFPENHEYFTLCVGEEEKAKLLRYRVDNKKKLFTWSSECGFKIPYSFCGIAPKSYSVQTMDEMGNVSQKLGSKGVSRCMADLKHERFLKFLLGKKSILLVKYKQMTVKRHRVYFKYGMKTAFRNIYEKRFLLPCGNKSVAFGSPEEKHWRDVEHVVEQLILAVECDLP